MGRATGSRGRQGSRGRGDPLLRTRDLAGDLAGGLVADLAGYWAFTVDEDLRVLFRWDGDVAALVTIGTHDEVY